MDWNHRKRSNFDPKKPWNYPRPEPTQLHAPLSYIEPFSWPRLPLPRTPTPSPPSSPDRNIRRKIDKVEPATPHSPDSLEHKLIKEYKEWFPYYSLTTPSLIRDTREVFPSYESPEDTKEELKLIRNSDERFPYYSLTIPSPVRDIREVFPSYKSLEDKKDTEENQSGAMFKSGMPLSPVPGSASCSVAPCVSAFSTTPSHAKAAPSGVASPGSPEQPSEPASPGSPGPPTATAP